MLISIILYRNVTVGSLAIFRRVGVEGSMSYHLTCLVSILDILCSLRVSLFPSLHGRPLVDSRTTPRQHSISLLLFEFVHQTTLRRPITRHVVIRLTRPS